MNGPKRSIPMHSNSQFSSSQLQMIQLAVVIIPHDLRVTHPMISLQRKNGSILYFIYIILKSGVYSVHIFLLLKSLFHSLFRVISLNSLMFRNDPEREANSRTYYCPIRLSLSVKSKNHLTVFFFQNKPYF